MAQIRKSHPRFKREGTADRIELTSDDTEILLWVYRHRFVSSEDLYRLFGSRSPDKLSRRLTRLFRNGYLDRPQAQIDYFREGGSRPYVYALDIAGARYLKEARGIPIGATDWRARNRSYTRENMDHTLAISRYLVDLEIACRPRSDVSLIPFDHIVQNAREGLRRTPVTAQWAVPIVWRRHSADVQLMPDAIFGLRLKSDDGRVRQNFVFLEIDRGSMTISPAERTRDSEAFVHRATVLRKLICYAESYRQELHKELGIPAARMLMLTTNENRAEVMRAATQEFVVEYYKVPPGLFLFGVLGARDDPFETQLQNSARTLVKLLPNVP